MPHDSKWQDRLSDHLLDRKHRHLFRQRTIIEKISPAHVRMGGRQCVNFAGNDYLGLSQHPRVIASVQAALGAQGFGSGASALICGYTSLHSAAEMALADWKHTERAVLLPSGYQANFAAIQTLSEIGSLYGQGVRFLLDKLVHASLIDAVRASGRPYRIFPHNHLPKLHRLLQDADPDQLQVVVTESVFSMDGDLLELAGLAELKKEHPFLLLLDEAHGSGVFGPDGSGLAAELGLNDVADVTVVTLSKALGGAGGAVCASAVFCDALVNFGRAMIYSTNLPGALAAGAAEAIAVMRDEPQRQQRLRASARRLRKNLGDIVAPVASLLAAESPIIPIHLGTEERALAMGQELQEEGLLVVAVRPPTVPKGGSRLRVTVSAEHSDADIDRLTSALLRRMDVAGLH